MSDVTVTREGVTRRITTSSLVLAVLCAMYFLFYIDRVNISTAATRIQTDLHLSNAEIGFVFSAFAYPYAFFQIFGGWIADRFGPRRTLFWSGLIVGVTTMATGLAGGLGSLFLIRLLLGFGEGAAFPTATRAMASWSPASSWGWAQGVTHSASRLGNAITPTVVSLLIITSSWRISFIAVGAVSFLWAAVWWWFFRDDPRLHPRVTQGELAILAVTARGSDRQPVPWGTLIRRIAPVTAVDFCYGWILWLFLNWLPGFFQKSSGLNLKTSALFASAVFFAGVVGDSLGGVISDFVLRASGSLRLARCGVIAFGLIAGCICLLLLRFADSLPSITMCLAGAFFFVELVVAPIWAIPMDIAPHHAGKASGLMNLGFGIAGVISPVVIGFIIDATGSRTLPFILSAALLVAGAALTLLVHPERALPDAR